MTYEQNVRAILECNFAETKDEIIDIACESICELSRWIPCSERLPSEDGQYLVWAVIGFVPDHVDMPSTYQEISIAYYSSTSKIISWYGINSVEKVLAWMPLPEPYEESEE